jgi:hypothetical protein
MEYTEHLDTVESGAACSNCWGVTATKNTPNPVFVYVQHHVYIRIAFRYTLGLRFEVL